MRTEPTEQQNRAAIDAIKAEEKFPEGCSIKDARSGYNASECMYVVNAVVNGNDRMIAVFEADEGSGMTKDMSRFLAEDLTRRINAGDYNG